MKKTLFLFIAIIMISACHNDTDVPDSGSISGSLLLPRSKKMLTARTVEICPNYPMYKERSAKSIADEIVVNGFKGVYYFVTSEKDINNNIIEALHARDIPVAMLIIASGAYLPDNERPANWENWKMMYTKGGNAFNSYKFMSFVYKDYAKWMKKRVVRLIKTYDFDGFTFAEVMYPIYDGLEKNPVIYADISPGFQNAFKEETGNTDFPEFEDKNDPNYYKKRTKLYKDLVNFRIKTINDFYNGVVNGPGGVREQCPGKFVATWTLGVYDSGRFSDPVRKLREWEGDDIPSMISQVKPDMHFIQTHYPDWMSSMNGDYIKHYRPFFNTIRNTVANIPIGVQTDIGSFEWCRKSTQWLNLFYKTCKQMNISSTTYYEFSIRWEIYKMPPDLREVKAINDTILELSFDQRVAKNYCENLVLGRKFIIGDNGKEYTVQSAEVDGNLLKIVLDNKIKKLRKITVRLGGIKDDLKHRFSSGNDHHLPIGNENIIPNGITKVIKINKNID